MATDTNLNLKPGETLAQYTARSVDYLRNTSSGQATMSTLAKEAPANAPLGSKEYTNTLVDRGPSLGMNLEQYRQNTTPVITPESLAPVQPLNVSVPNQTYAYPVAGLNTELPELKATPAEKEQSGVISQLKGLYQKTLGKSAFTTEQEKLAGIPELTKAQNDLVSQLTGIKNEAAAIPLQLQQGAADRGVTTPLLGAQENSRLRTNAIAALGVSTLLEASRGNLATAQTLVDRAVAQKYDPIMEEINVLRANLELILQDPETSLQDKNRAQKQMQLQNQQAMQLEQAQNREKEVWNIATTAASNGQNFKPTPQFPSLATTLQAISQAPTKEIALQIGAATNLVQGMSGSSDQPTSIQEYEYARNQGYTGSFTDFKNSKGSGSDTVNLTPTDKQGLLGAGFTNQEIGQIESDINNYGINAVLDGLTDTKQKKAIQSAYGAEDTNQFLNEEYFAGLFSEDALKKAAEEAGFRKAFTQWETEKQNYLKSLMKTVEQYRTAGYSDQEILKMMQ